MSTGYAHQDWKTVVLRPTSSQSQNKQSGAPRSQGNATVSSVANKPAWKIEQQVDSDLGKPINFVQKKEFDAIKTMRIQAKLTQAQLAANLNMKPKYIHDIESGKAVENKADLARIKKYLQNLVQITLDQ